MPHDETTADLSDIDGQLEAVLKFIAESEGDAPDYYGPSAEGITLFRGLMSGNSNGGLTDSQKQDLRSSLDDALTAIGTGRVSQRDEDDSSSGPD